MKKKIDRYSIEYPPRKKAVEILEAIAEKLGKEDIFDCKNGDTKWFDFEDMIVDILDYDDFLKGKITY